MPWSERVALSVTAQWATRLNSHEFWSNLAPNGRIITKQRQHGGGRLAEAGFAKSEPGTKPSTLRSHFDTPDPPSFRGRPLPVLSTCRNDRRHRLKSPRCVSRSTRNELESDAASTRHVTIDARCDRDLRHFESIRCLQNLKNCQTLSRLLCMGEAGLPSGRRCSSQFVLSSCSSLVSNWS